MRSFEWETWLIDSGHEVITKEAAEGSASLSVCERLIHSLWVADYGMGNAGDLDTAFDLHPNFQSEGLIAAKELGLPRSTEMFSLDQNEFEASYEDRFDEVCSEISNCIGR